MSERSGTELAARPVRLAVTDLLGLGLLGHRTVLVGVVAGVHPSMRAARLSPTEALASG